MCSKTKCTDGHNEAEFGMSWCAGFGGSFYYSYFEVLLLNFQHTISILMKNVYSNLVRGISIFL
jgi:hypothetical protein